jgi:glycosyltransferase involved in cell wall biosynthesis
MKIMHVITTIIRGGAENHLFDLVSGQVKAGHQVVIAYLKGDGYWLSNYEKINVNCIKLKMKYYGDLLPVLKLKCLSDSFEPDVIHAHMPPAEVYSRILFFFYKRKTKFIITKHLDGNFFNKLNGKNKTLISEIFVNFIAKRTDHIIAISDSVKNYFIKNELKNSRIETIKYGIDTSSFKKITNFENEKFRKEFSIKKETYLIGTVCRLVPQKSLEILIESFALFQSTYKWDTMLMIVGTGPLQGDLKILSKKLNVEDKIIWTGFREDIAIIMNSFDVFILTSSYEGFGLVFLEAMASSTPVIGTNISAIPEVIGIDGGILVPVGRVDLFAIALNDMSDINIRKKYGIAALNRVETLFSVEDMVQKTLALYEK